MSITRRGFIAGTAAAASGLLAGCRNSATSDRAATTLPVPTSTSSTSAATTATTVGSTTTTVAPRGNRVLVLVQLGGGNDALNTLVPLDGRYHDLRPTVGLADDTLVSLAGSDRYGLHPAFAAMRPLLDAGLVATIAGVGYAKPNRSHFVATDDWASGTPGEAPTTGWLGRYIDASGRSDDSPIRAVSLGNGSSALRGRSSQPTVVTNPASFKIPTVGTTDIASAWRTIVGDEAVAASAAVDTFAKVTTSAELNGYDDSVFGGDVTNGLITAAELIAQEPDVQIIQVSVGGFDTHSNQPEVHAALLQDVAEGLQAFHTRMTATGDADRVLVMTFSEFGRRVAENGSKGTDHGKAGVHFVMGNGVMGSGLMGNGLTGNGGLVGGWDLANLDDGDLRGAIDPRSMYTTALDWLGADPTEILGGTYDNLIAFR